MSWPSGTLVNGTSSGGSGGLDQLTGDVAAGPGTGSQVATISGLAISKLAALAAAKIMGSVAGGVPSELSITEVLDLLTGAAQGDIIYRDTAAWNNLAPGTSGRFLKTQGAGANPIWADVSVAGGVQFATVTLTAAQIRSLLSTPVNIVAAQGAGTLIVPICVAYKSAITVAFSGGQNFTFGLNGGGNFIANAQPNSGGTDTGIILAPIVAANVAVSQANGINKPLQLSAGGDVTGGTGVIYVNVAYFVATGLT